jgi:hypothetical protein
MIAWLDFMGSHLGLSVEEEAIFCIRHRLQEVHSLMRNKGAYGGRPALTRLHASVRAFVDDGSVNCGPGTIETKAFKATIAEIHGDVP